MHQRQCLSSISVAGRSTPLAALLTTMSSRSKCCRNSTNSSSTLSGIATLALIATARRPSAADLGANCLRLVVAVVVVRRHVATCSGEFQRDRPADTARGAGDECDLSNEWSGHYVLRGSPAAGKKPRDFEAEPEKAHASKSTPIAHPVTCSTVSGIVRSRPAIVHQLGGSRRQAFGRSLGRSRPVRVL